MKRIAVIDVAADSGGALSVLSDFYDYIKNTFNNNDFYFYFFTSVIELNETQNIKCIKNEFIKKSWLCRLFWEYFIFPKIFEKENFDIVLSLQNKTMPRIHSRQIVYFHNSLHLVKKNQLKSYKRYDKKIWIYRHLVSPIVLHSLKRAEVIIVQTNSVKKRLKKYVNRRIETVYPNVNVKSQNNSGNIKGFIYPAMPEPYKNMELIVNAEKVINEHNKHDIIFTFSGDENKYARKIRKSAKGIENIKFIGWQTRENIFNLYHTYGLIFTSLIESFPIPFAEAKAYGVPIIAVGEDYAQEILEGYGNKIICDRNNLSMAIEKALQLKITDGEVDGGDKSSWGQVMDIIVNSL